VQKEELRLLTGVKKKAKIKKLFNHRIEMEIELMEFKRSDEFKTCRKEGRLNILYMIKLLIIINWLKNCNEI
jgi:hypothetical protein